MTVELKRWRPAASATGHAYMSYDMDGEYVAIDSYNELREALVQSDKARHTAEANEGNWRWQATRLELVALERLGRIEEFAGANTAQFKQIASLSNELAETISRVAEMETERDALKERGETRDARICESTTALRDALDTIILDALVKHRMIVRKS